MADGASGARRPFLGRLRIGAHALVLASLGLVFLPGPLEALFGDFGADLDQALPPRAIGHYEAMRAHFESPFDGYGPTEVFTPQFGAILLSHAAIGFLNVGLADPGRRAEALEQLEEVARRAVSPQVSPYHRDLDRVRAFGDHNLYLSHLGLVLGARKRLGGDDRYDALHGRLARHLRRRSLRSGNGHARSYPGSARFPADQAATLAALHLYDLTHDSDLAARPVDLWLRTMERRGTDRSTGLHRSSMTPTYRHARTPRGCALSWSALYMAQFAPDEGRDAYSRYREHFLIHVGGLGGFREYPAGVEGRWDVDSGPILLEMGVAATGLGIGPARIYGDREGYRAMMRTASTVGLPRALGTRRSYRAAPLIGEAILFHATTARRWEDSANASPAPPFEGEAPFPTLALVLALLFGLIGAFSVYRVVRLSAWRRGA